MSYNGTFPWRNCSIKTLVIYPKWEKQQIQIFGRPYPSHIMGCSCFTFDALYSSVFPPAGETFIINLQMCKALRIPLLYLTSCLSLCVFNWTNNVKAVLRCRSLNFPSGCNTRANNAQIWSKGGALTCSGNHLNFSLALNFNLSSLAFEIMKYLHLPPLKY